MMAAKPAALEAVDRKAVTGVGAPWYTSGAHMWKGAAATLKQRAASTISPPAASPGVSAAQGVIWRAISANRVVPATP
jgi:hypothetical protein